MDHEIERPPLAGILVRRPIQPGDDLVLIGLPDDSKSSYRTGPAEAPRAIRRAYDGDGYNAATETGLDLAGVVVDGGDWSPGPDWAATRAAFRTKAAELFRAGLRPGFLGGDHAVTGPIAEALGALGEPVWVVHLDAHPDLYPDFQGDEHSHACTGRRILDQPHVASLTQIGIRTAERIQAEAAAGQGDRCRIITAAKAEAGEIYLDHIPPDAPVYLTLDLDALDPAFAPGVSHPVPGGLSSRRVIDLIHGLPGRLIGFDVVELNPSRDLNDLTAVLAGRLVHELFGRMAAGDSLGD